MTNLAYEISTDLPAQNPVDTRDDDRIKNLAYENSSDLPPQNPDGTDGDDRLTNLAYEIFNGSAVPKPCWHAAR